MAVSAIQPNPTTQEITPGIRNTSNTRRADEFQKHLTAKPTPPSTKGLPIQRPHLNYTPPPQQTETNLVGSAKDGTNLASKETNAELKQIAEDFEQQIYALMWRRVFTAANVGGAETQINALEMLGPELMDQMVKAGMNKDSMGNLAQVIFEDLVRARDGNTLNTKMPNEEIGR